MKRVPFFVLLALLACLGFFLFRPPGSFVSSSTESSPDSGAVSSSPSTAHAGEPVSGSEAGPVHESLYSASRSGARPAAAQADRLLADGSPALPLTQDFLEKILDASEKSVSFSLPEGRTASGTVELLRRDAQGVLLVQGRLTSPEPGFYFFQRQTLPGVAGRFFGNIRLDKSTVAYRIDPIGPGGSSMLVKRSLDQVICTQLPLAAAKTANAPQAHPIDIPIPQSQNEIIPLQSLPGATGVIYLDFDGEQGPFPGWGNFDAAPSGATNTQIKEVWQRVAEDFQAFNLNVTTDLQVFRNAAENSRIHVILTPTDTASPGNGGVAQYWTFNATGDIVCWVFYWAGKTAAEAASHEIGHTMGLSHDGRSTPVEVYYGGHGTDPVGWAPIMGVGYSKNLSQWSKGEYLNANNFEDDLSIITNNNNSVDYRVDDYGANLAAAGYLEILANNSVSNEGILETNTDVDAFRFTTTGGAVSLTVNPVSSGPNLDIRAEIYDASDNLVASVNPDTQIPATVAATLAAGDYTLRVNGVGRGDPLATGYTNYGTIGAYLISGSVAGGVKPDRFSIAENSANGTAVGTVAPRNSHGANPLTFAIASGNTSGAFAINPATGALTVANSSQLNYEVLSLRWDDPATFELFVTITDSVDSGLNETVRVVVTVTNLNETPALSSGSITMLGRTPAGTDVLKITGSDPDPFDFPVFSITAGNTGNAFVIDASGQIKVATPVDPATQTVYSLTVRATDQGSPALFTEATVTITVLPTPAGYTPGTITRTFFEGISGSAVSNLTGNAKFPNNPDSEESLASFEGGQHTDNFGSTVRGYLIPPATGTYFFWIASDDSSQLLLSPNASPGSATQRASVSGFTNPRQYNKFSSQASAGITLTAGQPYYIEARHKEGGGGDHLTVAWSGPGIAQQVIPGLYLAPYYQNYAPKIPAASLFIHQGSYNGAIVGTVAVTDVNAQDTHGSFLITGGTGTSVFGIESATGRLYVTDGAALNAVATPSYTLQIQTTDNGSPALSGTGTVTINVRAPDAINLTGIAQQIWTGITNTGNLNGLLNDSRYPYAPTTSRTLALFDSGSNYADNYGDRIRAYVVPPVTDTYTFYLSSDDHSQLRFSTSSNPAGATVIATVNGWTNRNSWNIASTPVALTAGQLYYIETVHRDGGGGDHIQVAWSRTGSPTPAVIPGSALLPFNINAAPVWSGALYSFSTSVNISNGTAVGTVAASDPDGGTLPLLYAILSGNPGGAFSINASTGAITIADSSAVPRGQTTTLTVGAQDQSGGGIYPPKESTTTVAISVPLAPIEQWRQDQFTANAGNPLIAGNLADPDGDGLTNLVEYALGLNPLIPGASGVVVDWETIGPDAFLRLTAAKNPNATDVTFVVEVSGSLAADSWTTAGTTTSVNTSTVLRVRDNTSANGANTRFIRLKVSWQ
jgi:hypothetical protein